MHVAPVMRTHYLGTQGECDPKRMGKKRMGNKKGRRNGEEMNE